MNLTPLSALLKQLGLKYLIFIAMISLACLLSYSAQAAETATHDTHIRTLAASCAACHGTKGNSHSITPVLAGLDANYFSTQMYAFKNKSLSSTVMHHHAAGLTDSEIEQLAQYFAQQKRISIPSPTPQTLEASHD